VHRHDGVVGQLHARVQLGDPGIVPLGDLALVDPRQHRTAQLDMVAVQPRQVVVHHLRRDRQRDVQHFGMLLHLRIAEIGVRGPDLRDPRDRFRNTGARAGALGGDLQFGVVLGVGRHPEIEERIEQAGACLEDIGLLGLHRPGDQPAQCHGGRQHGALRRCGDDPAVSLSRCHVVLLGIAPASILTVGPHGSGARTHPRSRTAHS
jgi:hypothetical protein